MKTVTISDTAREESQQSAIAMMTLLSQSMCRSSSSIPVSLYFSPFPSSLYFPTSLPPSLCASVPLGLSASTSVYSFIALSLSFSLPLTGLSPFSSSTFGDLPRIPPLPSSTEHECHHSPPAQTACSPSSHVAWGLRPRPATPSSHPHAHERQQCAVASSRSQSERCGWPLPRAAHRPRHCALSTQRSAVGCTLLRRSRRFSGGGSKRALCEGTDAVQTRTDAVQTPYRRPCWGERRESVCLCSRARV